MAKRYVGIERNAQEVRIAILEEGKEGLSLRSLERRSCAEGPLPQEWVAEFGLDHDRFNLSAATALPSGSGYVRDLQIPFREEKKIRAVLTPELGGRLPVDLSGYILDYTGHRPDQEGALTAAAVPGGLLPPLLADLIWFPPRFVDLAPYAYAAGAGRLAGDLLLVHLHGAGCDLMRVCEGIPMAVRSLASTADAPEVARTLRMMLRAEAATLPVIGMGIEGVESLIDYLVEQGSPRLAAGLRIGGQPVPPAYLPAVFLAWRAATPQGGFNFRRGAYAYRNEWNTLRRRMIAGAVLLGLSLVMGVAGMTLEYSRRARAVDALQNRISAAYTELFPGAAVVDPLLQIRQARDQLRIQARVMGAGERFGALGLLRELSVAGEKDGSIELKDFSLTSDQVRLEGSAASFEGVNAFAKGIEAGRRIASVKIEDAKSSPDGSRVDFRIQITVGEGGGK